MYRVHVECIIGCMHALNSGTLVWMAAVYIHVVGILWPYSVCIVYLKDIIIYIRVYMELFFGHGAVL